VGKNTKRCPVCKGKKVVEKVRNDEICYYADRITVIKEPCRRCNGNGIIMKGTKKKG